LRNHYSITPSLHYSSRVAHQGETVKPPLGETQSPDSLLKSLPVTDGKEPAVRTKSLSLSLLGTRQRFGMEDAPLELVAELSQTFFPDTEQILPLLGISPETIQFEIFFRLESYIARLEWIFMKL
jgi:hypothetical protein